MNLKFLIERDILDTWLKSDSLNHRIADNEDDAEELWEVRRQGSSSMKKLATTKLNEDIVVLWTVKWS